MSGLSKICKMYGKMKVGNVMWVYDYVNDRPRIEKEMSKEELAASEKAKWDKIKNKPTIK